MCRVQNPTILFQLITPSIIRSWGVFANWLPETCTNYLVQKRYLKNKKLWFSTQQNKSAETKCQGYFEYYRCFCRHPHKFVFSRFYNFEIFGAPFGLSGAGWPETMSGQPEVRCPAKAGGYHDRNMSYHCIKIRYHYRNGGTNWSNGISVSSMTWIQP